MKLEKVKPQIAHQGEGLAIVQKGFVVVVVLCMVILLAVLLLGFNHKSRANLLAMEDFQKSKQALNCARAGLNIAIAALKSTDDIYCNSNLLNLLSGEHKFFVGDGDCSVTVTEENGKLNVNLLKDKNGVLNRTAIDQLLRLIDLLNRQNYSYSHIGYGLAPSIIDWVDADDQVTCLSFIKNENLGVESPYYRGLDLPYQCKNKPLDTAEELLFVKGVTWQVFNRIRDYITVKGDGKVNINSASKLVIESLSEQLSPVLAQTIIDRRRIKPFESITELRNVPGMTDSIYYAIRKTATVNPADRYYYVVSQGSVDRFSCMIIAVLRKNTDAKSVDVVLYKEL